MIDFGKKRIRDDIGQSGSALNNCKELYKSLVISTQRTNYIVICYTSYDGYKMTGISETHRKNWDRIHCLCKKIHGVDFSQIHA